MRIQFREYRDLFSKYLRPRWRKVLLLTGLMLAGIALQVANPQIIRYFIDTALAGGSQQGLVYAALIFLAFALTTQAPMSRINVGLLVSFPRALANADFPVPGTPSRRTPRGRTVFPAPRARRQKSLRLARPPREANAS